MKYTNTRQLKTLIGVLSLSILFLLPIIHNTRDTSASEEEKIQPIDKKTDKALTEFMFKEKISGIDSFLTRHQKRYNFQGNILVGHKGHIIYKQAFGYANPKTKTKLDENSVFQLASVTKQFTATAIMLLQQKGYLSYNDTVQKYISDFPYEGITIEMLLNHTSGLPNYMWLLENRWNENRIPDNDDVLKLLNKHKLNLYFTPGTRFNYSNTGYVVLASIIEKVSGIAYGEFLDEYIFSPLEMENSFVYNPANPETTEKKVSGYRTWGRSYRTIPNTINDGAVGDKGVYSTVNDLYKWDQALYGNELLTKENKEKAFEPVTLRNGYQYPYGFGFRLKEIDSSKVVYHYGKWNGFRTGLIRFIEDSTTVVILNHTNRPGNSKITRNIEDILNAERS